MFIIFDGTGPANDGDYAVEFAESHCRMLSLFAPKPVKYIRGPAGDDPISGLKRLWRSNDKRTEVLEYTDNVLAFLASNLYDGAAIDFFLRRYRRLAAPEDASRQGVYVKYSVEEALKFVKQNSNVKEKLFVAGYSRGGAAALIFARALNFHIPNIKIEAMFLFDAVGMILQNNIFSGFSINNLDNLSPNIKNFHHAYRSNTLFYENIGKLQKLNEELRALQQQASSWENLIPTFDYISGQAGNSSQTITVNERIAELELKIATLELALEYTRSDSRTMASRLFNNWGNVGLRPLCDPKQQVEFRGSHGALGGCPWPENVIPGDSLSSASVKAWMWPIIKSYMSLHFSPGKR